MTTDASQHSLARRLADTLNRSAGRQGHWLYTGKQHPSGYVRLVVNGKAVTGPRAMFFLTHGTCPATRLFRVCDEITCLQPLQYRMDVAARALRNGP